MTNPIDWLATKVENDPDFLAPVLMLFARSERLDEAGLAAALGCSLEDLSRLKVCRPPRPACVWEDVATLADHFDLDPDCLLAVVRRGQAIQQWQRMTPASGQSTLLAARDEGPPTGVAPEGS